MENPYAELRVCASDWPVRNANGPMSQVLTRSLLDRVVEMARDCLRCVVENELVEDADVTGQRFSELAKVPRETTKISDKQELEPILSAKSFVRDYQLALNTQDWNSVEPLISNDAIVIFSNGSLHAGKAAIRAAFQQNFNTINGEDFRIINVKWLVDTAESAAYSFEFHWTGITNSRRASSSGRGTAVLIRRDDRWLLVGEQLGPKL